MVDASENEAKKKGRAAFVPTDEQRAEVRKLSLDKATHAVIAQAIGISIPTLRKAFVEELADRIGPDNLFAAAGASAPATERPAPARRPGVGGRKRYRPDDAARAKVQLLVAAGTSVEDIAAVLEITAPTLRRYFEKELTAGAAKMRAHTLLMLFSSARKGNVSAQKALLDVFERGHLAALEAEFREKTDSDQAPKPEPVGKKTQASLDAFTAHEGTEWQNLMQ